MLQVTAMFKLNEIGWSETHWYQSTDPADLIDSLGTPTLALQNWLDARLGVMVNSGATVIGPDLTHNPYLVRVRVSNLDFFRVNRIYRPATPAQALGTYAGPEVANNKETTEAWTRLEVDADLTDSNNNARQGHIYMGGVPEAELAAPDIYNPSPSYTIALFNYFSVLTGTGTTPSLWRTKLRQGGQVGAGAPFPAQEITNFAVALDGRSVQLQPILINGVAAPTRGNLIIRARHPSEWNGVHRFTLSGIFPNQVLLLGPARQPLGDWAPTLGPGPYTGTVQMLYDNFAKYNRLFDAQFISRQSGRPFGLSVGRRKRAR